MASRSTFSVQVQVQVPTTARMSPPADTKVQIDSTSNGLDIVLPPPAWKGTFLCYFITVSVICGLFSLFLVPGIFLPLDPHLEEKGVRQLSVGLLCAFTTFYIAWVWVSRSQWPSS